MTGCYGQTNLGSHRKSGAADPTFRLPHLVVLVHSATEMGSRKTNSQDVSVAQAPPTFDELQEAFSVEVFDRAGVKKTLGDIINGKRSILIFTRHFCTSELNHEALWAQLTKSQGA